MADPETRKRVEQRRNELAEEKEQNSVTGIDLYIKDGKWTEINIYHKNNKTITEYADKRKKTVIS